MDCRIALLILSIIFAILPMILLFTFKKMKYVKIAYLILFICYTIVLFSGVFLNISIKQEIIIKPYKFIANAKKVFHLKLFTKNIKDIIINISMFIPFGFFLTALFRKFKVLKTISIGTATTIFIEVVQYFLPNMRTAQLSDIIMNIVSCTIGSLLFIGFYALRRKIKKENNIITST